jgi:hypothetical protein
LWQRKPARASVAGFFAFLAIILFFQTFVVDDPVPDTPDSSRSST